MKKLNFYIFLAAVAALLSSCAVSTARLRVLVPADINVPPHLKKVVVANRSLPASNERGFSMLEGFVTGESIFADREGAEKCTQSLVDELNRNPRYGAVLKLDQELRGTGTGEFPVRLNWDKVISVCREYGADGLILLETFDSDIGLITGVIERKEKKDNKEIIVKVHKADLSIDVNCGWRIYDAENRNVVDEQRFTDRRAWSAEGTTKEDAIASLPRKRAAINEAGIFAGKMYSKRISPTWQWVDRSYYVRKDDEFRKAKKLVREKEWDKAAEIWKRLEYSKDPKTAGRACYNMAVASEREGNLALALTWATKAWEQYKLKAAKSYIGTINKRLRQQERLNEQMD